MKHIILMAAVCLASLMLVHPASAELKLAFVDLEQTFDQYGKTKQADEKLKELAEEFNQDREKMVAEMDQLRDDFNSVRAEALDKALSEEVRTEKRNEAEERLMDIRAQEEKIRRFDQLRAKQLEEQGQRMREGIVEEIQKVIRDYARINGYTVVIDASGKTLNGIEGVLYYDPDLDITREVIEKLNADSILQERGDER